MERRARVASQTLSFLLGGALDGEATYVAPPRSGERVTLVARDEVLDIRDVEHLVADAELVVGAHENHADGLGDEGPATVLLDLVGRGALEVELVFP